MAAKHLKLAEQGLLDALNKASRLHTVCNLLAAALPVSAVDSISQRQSMLVEQPGTSGLSMRARGPAPQASEAEVSLQTLYNRCKLVLKVQGKHQALSSF